MLRYHTNYITRYYEDGSPFKEFVGLAGCRACSRRCKGCHQPFTLSTADDDEHNYCSARCEKQGAQPRPIKRNRHHNRRKGAP